MRILHRRTESGATAVLVAILAIVLFGVGALTVDLGQAYAKKRDMQTTVDLAVLAAAAELPDSESEATLVAEKYLSDNFDLSNTQSTGVWDLDDGNDVNGEIYFPDNSVRLVAPPGRVEFGLARVLGQTSADISASAAVELRSPVTAVMPAFAVSGCDFGLQTLLAPASGHETPVAIPELQEDGGPYNDATLEGPLAPSSIELGASSSLTITGKKLNGVTHIGFSTDIAGTNMHVEMPATPSDHKTVTLPGIHTTVTSTEDVWYIRVSKDGGITWSKDALPFQVGDAVLECAGESNKGNFGTLDFDHLNPPATSETAIEWNIATQIDFDLSIFPGDPPPPRCGPEAVKQPNGGTNCVDTKPGFGANPATGGLITGPGSSTPGRLDATERPTSCPGRSDFTTPKVKGSKYDINNDILTCFFTDSTTTIGDITKATYAGGSVISADVFESPRFFWIPVLGERPGSDKAGFSIIDFRPAFLIDQPKTADATNNTVGTETENGLVFESNGVTQMKVVFFNANALPETLPAGGETAPYWGVGPKVLTLVE